MKARLSESKRSGLWEKVLANWRLYVLILPAIIYLIVFCYMPMYGVQIAFRDYRAVRGVTGSAWVGLKHFETFFSAYYFGRLILNTFLLNVLSLIFSFPIPILLALMINSLKNARFKKLTQTVVYVPHFISSVVLAGLMYILLSPSSGLINQIIQSFGGNAIYFMNEENWFRPIYIISGIWQGAGWGSILYIAALAGIDTELYEASVIDGATKLQQIRYIDIPYIIPTATMMLILNCGALLSSATQKTLLLQTGGNMAVSDIIGTYVYTMGMGKGQYSYTTAIGLFVNIINFILVVCANKMSNKLQGETLF